MSSAAATTPGVAPAAGTPALVVWDMSGGGGGGGAVTTTPSAYSGVFRAEVAANLASVELCAARIARVFGGVIFNNDPEATLYVVFGAGPATVTGAAYGIAPGGSIPIAAGFTGAVHGIWAGGVPSGNAAVHEFVA